MSDASNLLSVEDLRIHFPVRKGLLQKQSGAIKAVDGVSLTIRRGETVSLVGESGCGKSTTGLALMGLVQATGGRVALDGEGVTDLRGAKLRAHRRRMQIIFQDPFSSLNPRQRVRDIIRAPLDIHGVGTPQERAALVATLMKRVGLRPDQADNFPHQFSGGQRQRIGIARALALNPDIIICDEPVSALDVSVQAQILNLLTELQRDLGISYLFISHDLGVVEYISHRVAVMYLGKIVELAAKAELFVQPIHPYTELLLGSAPTLDPRARGPLTLSADDMPSASNKPAGCAFHTRCPLVSGKCRTDEPALTARGDGRLVACHNR